MERDEVDIISKIFKASLCKTPKNLDKLNSANTGPEDLTPQRNAWRSNFQIFTVSSAPWCTKRVTVKISCLASKEQTPLRVCTAHTAPRTLLGTIQGAGRVFLISEPQLKVWLLPCRVKATDLDRNNSFGRFRRVESTKCSLTWADTGSSESQWRNRHQWMPRYPRCVFLQQNLRTKGRVDHLENRLPAIQRGNSHPQDIQGKKTWGLG